MQQHITHGMAWHLSVALGLEELHKGGAHPVPCSQQRGVVWDPVQGQVFGCSYGRSASYTGHRAFRQTTDKPAGPDSMPRGPPV